jgi:tetratricopeptide (TPR) repeat protein
LCCLVCSVLLIGGISHNIRAFLSLIPALQALQRGDHHSAVSKATAVIGKYPRYAAAFELRGQAELALGHQLQARADLETAIHLGGRTASLSCDLAWSYWNDRLWNEMRAEAEFAVKYDPANSMAHTLLSASLAGLRQINLALREADLAVKLRGDLSLAFQIRGHIRAYQERFHDAILDYEKAIQLDPLNWSAMSKYAALLATCQNEEYRDGRKALELSKRACGLTKHDVAACLLVLSEAHAELGEFEEALRWAEHGRKKSVDDATRFYASQQIMNYTQGMPWRSNTFGDP